MEATQEDQSRYSSHARAHTVKLGRMTTWKIPTPGLAAKPHLAYQATQTPLFSKPFDVTLWQSGVPQMLTTSLDIESDFRNGFFGILHIYLKVESNFYGHY